MRGNRENLIRENFELERDYHYMKFREYHWNLPEIVKACPDEGQRDRLLRGYWNQEAEKRYPEYRAAIAGLSISELLNERERWIEKLDCQGMLEYRKTLERAARRPANDNKKGHER